MDEYNGKVLLTKPVLPFGSRIKITAQMHTYTYVDII